MKEHILITGGAGYLGSILTRLLLEKGYRVRILDNMTYGYDSILPLGEKYKNELSVVIGDIKDSEAIITALDGVDKVIHLASIVGWPAANLDVKGSQVVNTLATRNLVELCNIYGIKHFYFASTCSVYGSQSNVLISENSSLIPVDKYAETKLACEKYILNEAKMPYTILRLATLFGLSYRMRYDLAINAFIAKALNGEKLDVYGGEQYRPFLHVSDAAIAFVSAVEHEFSGIYNVAGMNYKILDVANEIAKELNATVEISKEIVDQRDYQVTAEKFNKLFEYEPLKKVKDAINEIKLSETHKNYNNKKYSNYGTLMDLQKVRTEGPIFEKTKEEVRI